MKKQPIVTGVLTGVVLAAFLFVMAATSMSKSRSFYQGQDERYDKTAQLNLKDTAEYYKLYGAFVKQFKGKTEANAVLQKMGDPSKYSDTFFAFAPAKLKKGEKQSFEWTFMPDEKYLSTVNELNEAGFSDALRVRFDLVWSLPEGQALPTATPAGSLAERFRQKDTQTEAPRQALNTLTVVEAALLCGDEAMPMSNNAGSRGQHIALENTVVSKEPGGILRLNMERALTEAKPVTLRITLLAEEDYTLACEFSSRQHVTPVEAASRIGGGRFTALTEKEQNDLHRAFVLGAWLQWSLLGVFVLCIAACVFSIKKNGRASLKPLGRSMVIASAGVAVILNVLLLALPGAWGWAPFVTVPDSTTAYMIDNAFIKDFQTGLCRFFDFLALIPLALGYLTARLAKKRQDRPDGEYLYQS